MIQSTLSRLAESRAPLHLLQGATQLREHFTIELVDAGPDGLPRLGLTTKDTDGRRILIGVDPDTSYIRTLVMHELNGNVTSIGFADITANSDLPDTLFQCDMPSNVEVIEDLP